MRREGARIEAVDLRYEIGGRAIVDGVGFELRGNELLGVVGPNGAGKSTLFRLATGILRPSGGGVFLDGEDIARYEAKRLYAKVAFVPQNTYFDFPFRAVEVVLTGRYPHLGTFENESPEDMRLAERCLGLVDMGEFSQRDVTTLSGGEQQRVSIARALAQETDFIFLDEPVSHLDVHHKLEVMELLKSLAGAGKGVAVVLHDLGLARRFCDRILVLENGKNAAFGEPSFALGENVLSSVFGVKAASADLFCGNLTKDRD